MLVENAARSCMQPPPSKQSHRLESTLNGSDSLYLTNNSLQGEIPNNLTSCTKLIYLFLTGNQLTGKLPTQLGSLAKLVVLELSLNYFEGAIPSSLSNMSALIVISLSSSNLYGNIPSEIGKLSRLEFFQVSGNNLSGTIPAQLFNISSIYLFAAADNQLHGSIPSNLGNTLPNLRTLALGGNVFSGSLPSSISNVSRLSQLDFSRNRFTGDVPPNLGSLQDLVRLSLGENQLGTGEADDLIFFTSLSNCSHLEVLALTGNNLSGQLPDSIASLSTKLTKLYMGGNRVFGKIAPGIENLVSLNGLAMENNLLTGSIPVFIGKLPNLVIAAMSGNQLSGQMPSNICNSTRLEEIYCDRNRLQDQIPPNLGNCPKLRVLNLAQNQLSDTVRPQLIGLSSLSVKLDLSWNLLTRVIPPFLESIEGIKNLDLSSNCLSGEVPKQGIFDNISAFSILGNNNLCGGISLLHLPSCPTPAAKKHSKEFPSMRLLLIIFAASYSFSFGENKRERLDIAIDVASALDYLHHHCQRPIVHRDLKPSNILLDNNMNGHVSDFGHAKFLGGVAISVESEYHTTSTSVGIRGAVGYAAPEYGMGREVSTNGDVYSYGILLLEMFTGRRPTDDMFKDGSSLHTFAKTSLLTNQVMQIIDPDILLVPLHLQGNDDSNNDDYNKEEELISGEMATRVC
ncbi:hypothetical protein C5167_015531 [Papaver somniferum]|uniref:non-specific serine/threonine protein kinase n=1 Tax=Papaver somniferum TaxID=3469 RepID=A0A4Y7J9F3_PAPSO|nr:hypothetical protein C5167_015531 [Papaver somniferum]